MTQIPVRGHEHVEPVLGRRQQIAIGESRPAEFVRGFYLVGREILLKRNRGALIEHDPHAGANQAG